MAITRGPKIIRNGLVLALDAADRNSYAGSGTAWKDLSGNAYNGTLINGPTFDSANGGSIVYDGIDDYINMGNILNLPSSDISGFSWVNITTLKNYTAIIDKLASTGNYRLHVMLDGTLQLGVRNSAGTYQAIAAGSIQIGRWYYLGFTLNNTTRLANTYINGINSTSGTFTIDRNSTSDNLLLGYTTNNTTYSNMKQATVSIYNRELSAAEVVQNYSATKSRFGL